MSGNPYTHTPVYAESVNVTNLMSRAWDKGFDSGIRKMAEHVENHAVALRAARDFLMAYVPYPECGHVLRMIDHALAEDES